MVRQYGDERVPGFVDGDSMFLFGQQCVRGVATADQETIARSIKIGSAQDVTTGSHGVDRRFVDQVGQISA